MQPIQPSSLGNDPLADALAEAIGKTVEAEPFASSRSAQRSRPAAAQDDCAKLLKLLHGCVDAMCRLQGQVAQAEVEATAAAEAHSLERKDLRDEVDALQNTLKLTASRFGQYQARLASLESRMALTTNELEISRSETRAWQLRAEENEKRFEHWQSRLAEVEGILTQKITSITQDLSHARVEANTLRGHISTGDSLIADMERRLEDARATAEDQRARIVCLHAKLAAATDLHRFAAFAHQPQPELAPSTADQGSIMDLKDIGLGIFVSAA